MASIQSNQIQKALREDPEYLLDTILANNMPAVSARMKYLYNITVNTPDAFKENLQMLLESYPDQAAEIIFSLLSVDIDGGTLTNDGSDAVLSVVIAQEESGFAHRNAIWDPYAGMGADAYNAVNGNPTTPAGPTSQSQVSGSGFNWGQLVSAALPGILGLFGLGGQPQSGTALTPQQQAEILRRQEEDNRRRQRNTLIGVAIGLFVLILIIVLVMRKK